MLSHSPLHSHLAASLLSTEDYGFEDLKRISGGWLDPACATKSKAEREEALHSPVQACGYWDKQAKVCSETFPDMDFGFFPSILTSNQMEMDKKAKL